MDRALDLSPMAGHPDISAVGVAPVTRNPASVAARRGCIPAWNPNVSASIPAVISGLPNPAVMHGCGDDFSRSWWGRPDVDIYLGRGHQAGCEDGGGYEKKKPLFHHSSSE